MNEKETVIVDTINQTVCNIGAQVKTDYTKIESIVELLIEKGVFTKEEFKSKFESILESDSEDLIRFLVTGENK